MYDEPYKWVEAVGNRRQYLDEQFRQGSPVVGVTYENGILLLTVSKGTPKLYEIYDRLALGGMGHPADLEKLRFTLLEMAHVEGFSRSPSDVTGSRMVKYGVAPVIKQAFEEVFKAPFILKALLVELGQKVDKDSFLTINYDGTFEEKRSRAVVAASLRIEQEMLTYLQEQPCHSLEQAISAAVCAWAVGERAQGHAMKQEGADDERAQQADPPSTDRAALYTYIPKSLTDKRIECAVLDRQVRGPSKYRAIDSNELKRVLPPEIASVL